MSQFSLKDAKKHGSRSSNKNGQPISVIASDNSINPSNNSSQIQQQPQQHDIRMNTQVKTYTDHGNGLRTGNSSNYSKVSKKTSFSFTQGIRGICSYRNSEFDKAEYVLTLSGVRWEVC